MTTTKFDRNLLDCSKVLTGGLESYEKEFGATSEAMPFCLRYTVEEFRAFLWALTAPYVSTDSLCAQIFTQ